jgi:FkbM family methyltransferase
MDWFGLYSWFRYSRGYEWYARCRRSGYAQLLANDRRFYRPLFDRLRIRSVFDLGANVGDKAQVFSELADRVVCVEADPMTASTLRHRFRKERRVLVEAVAVGSRPGSATLHRKLYSGYSTVSEKWADATLETVPTTERISVPVSTLDQLISVHGRPDYIKIDVEGSELEVIGGLSAPVGALSFEANLPTFLQETVAVADRLLQLCPRVRFQLRQADGPEFARPEAFDRNGLVDAIREARATFDIFAFSDD